MPHPLNNVPKGGGEWFQRSQSRRNEWEQHLEMVEVEESLSDRYLTKGVQPICFLFLGIEDPFQNVLLQYVE